MATKKKKRSGLRNPQLPVYADGEVMRLTTDKKRYSRPEVDKMIAEAMPEQTAFDHMVHVRREFENLNHEINHTEAHLRRLLDARKECEKRLAEAVAKVKSEADTVKP